MNAWLAEDLNRLAGSDHNFGPDVNMAEAVRSTTWLKLQRRHVRPRSPPTRTTLCGTGSAPQAATARIADLLYQSGDSITVQSEIRAGPKACTAPHHRGRSGARIPVDPRRKP